MGAQRNRAIASTLLTLVPFDEIVPMTRVTRPVTKSAGHSK
jgi:hypothetical protein